MQGGFRLAPAKRDSLTAGLGLVRTCQSPRFTLVQVRQFTALHPRKSAFSPFAPLTF